VAICCLKSLQAEGVTPKASRMHFWGLCQTRLPNPFPPMVSLRTVQAHTFPYHTSPAVYGSTEWALHNSRPCGNGSLGVVQQS
jgi:hypothetical protein